VSGSVWRRRASSAVSRCSGMIEVKGRIQGRSGRTGAAHQPHRRSTLARRFLREAPAASPCGLDRRCSVADDDHLVIGGQRVAQRQVMRVDCRGADPAARCQPRPCGCHPCRMQRCSDTREHDRPAGIQARHLTADDPRNRLRLRGDLIVGRESQNPDPSVQAWPTLVGWRGRAGQPPRAREADRRRPGGSRLYAAAWRAESVTLR
jgi:hypothetical protein